MNTYQLFSICFCLISLCLFGHPLELSLPIQHEGATLDLQFSDDGKYLVACTRSELKLWEAETGKLLQTISTNHSNSADCSLGFTQVAISANGNFIISAQACAAKESGTHNRPYDEAAGPTFIALWDTKTGKLQKRIQISPYRVFVQELTISPDDKQVAVSTATAVHVYGYVEGELAMSVWDIEAGQLLLERAYEKGQFSSQNDHVLATGYNAIHYINTLTRKEKASFFLDGEVQTMGMNDEGNTLFATTKGKLWTWDVDKATTPHTYDLPELAEYGTASFFSKDGQHLTILNWNKRLLIRYSLSDGSQLSSSPIAMDEGMGAVPRLAMNHQLKLLTYAHYPDIGAPAQAVKALRLFSDKAGFAYQ